MELEKPIVAPFKVLVIVAHPDDIEFGSAGSVAVWTAAGAEVIYCIVTDGAAGSNDKDVIYNQLVERRQAEQNEAAQIVGVKEVVFLGYADGALTPSMELRRDLTRLIRKLRPDRVLIMDPTQVLISGEGFDYINHPDHRAAGEASLYAVFPSAETRPIFPELLEEGLEPHHVNELYLMMNDKPNIAIDVTTVWDKKIQSLLAHRSQVGEDVADMIRKWDVATGKEVGVELAESYRVMRFIDATPEKDTPAE
ncbi:MAG: PIG-L family deacetylase [Chloroflexi bacterium]|uniref:PIG-L deacetylase family protein n=1 Tax=Candidatus Flexifilum breve TaxID=3140694 RepID=UPI0031375586|nr:PIG-L family deacetylase [Chloroflexota bacterium]